MIRLEASAKLNLYLRVVGKRADGYHELETLFERIDLADELTFEPHPSELLLSCDDPQLPCDETNLVLKAARALQAAAGAHRGAHIRLTKRIPIGAGLGGGSSDAATTLVGLNRLWALGLSRERLSALGAQLGSDVPFFLGASPFAIGRGRGERCEELPGPWPTLWHVLVVPPERLSTKAVYEGVGNLTPPPTCSSDSSTPSTSALSGESTEVNRSGVESWCGGLTGSASSINIVAHALRNGPALAGLASGIRNDLAAEAIRRCPIIEEIDARLRAGGCLAAAVTGSGSAVYGLVRDARHADEAAQCVRAHGDPRWSVSVVHTIIGE